MTMMAPGASHELVRTMLGPYVLGGLEHDERLEVEDHLRSCGSCQEAQSKHRHTATELRCGRAEWSSALWERIERAVRRPGAIQPPA
ncbi:MAG TPA: zf-HC2 domain-containing protein [Acidimicrobiales bacterium]|nr:zf-HC2 domain-containing protein [Acidimicrobiales bacterium]